jgi:phosphatidylglycerol:prolipoprotein diacylglycerol transferase
MCISILVGMFVLNKEIKKTNQSHDLYYDFLFYAILFGIIGARIYYVIFSWDNYKYNLKSIFALREGGIAIYGAIIFGFITAIIFCNKKKYNLNLLLDTCTPALMTGQIIGRW